MQAGVDSQGFARRGLLCLDGVLLDLEEVSVGQVGEEGFQGWIPYRRLTSVS